MCFLPMRPVASYTQPLGAQFSPRRSPKMTAIASQPKKSCDPMKHMEK